ncbi:hypothetical protein CROQUDRAFT_48827 [Cronartium quercuum f. sp. fusiforme G11]|uniref:tRNA (adenine(58)-N(1))-methyltransferase non-catalytic subunit TRM6 n=1 Tax=Cronartium quercuum f. sp. fusiforme G11 TaxID=708437 RepID=A0A9P6NBA7_9BASI|nr:hypothetical protein CROQUDRAFT_48827 [Cronartium quercuum f. sp. fusiforme G11]
MVNPCPTITTRSRRISPGDNLLLQLPSGLVKPVRNITANASINLGKFGTFSADKLLEQPYGLTYEIEEGKLVQTASRTVQTESCNVEDIAATNENIKESDGAQKMTGTDIEELKKSGLSGREIIERQIAQHAAFELKSEFSKEKYIKRKEKKFLKKFTCIEPTMMNITQYLFESSAMAIRGLRPDTLSQMLTLANVRPGWQGIVVDDVGGLVVAAVVERLGGSGTVLVINDADSPPDLHFLSPLNFPAPALAPLRSLNWAQLEPDWSSRETREFTQLSDRAARPKASHPPTRPVVPITSTVDELTNPTASSDALTSTVPPLPEHNAVAVQNVSSAVNPPAIKTGKESTRLSKKWERHREVIETRQRFFDGAFEGLIVCSEYEPQSIIDKLRSHLAGSASVVIHSPYLSPLASVQHTLRSASDFIHVTISEPWLRRYQVLPGRTHPEMNGTPGGGFLLSAIKVIAPVETNGSTQPKKKVRV